jgi:lipopolysaccharide transport system permease protein
MELIIAPKTLEKNYWKDIWRYRQLFFFLSWKEFLIRYKQTVLGISWSVIRPILTMVVFSVVFGKFAKMPNEGVPYPVLVFAALLPWQFFANALTESSNSLVGNANLISKIYFPRIIIPASSLIVSLVDFIISLVILGIIIIYYQFALTWYIFLIPMFLLLAIMAAYSLGIFFAALNVKYRDFKYVVPFIVQAGLYISPVGFSSSIVPAKWKLLYSLNPMVGVIDGFRLAIIGQKYSVYWPGIALAVLLTSILLFLSIKYFRATEKTFADII